MGSDGRVTGEAYVIFTSEEEANRARSRDKQSMGHRYIEVFPAIKADLYAALQPARPSWRPRDFPVGSADMTCVRMRGLPFSITVDDILKFFHGKKRKERKKI